MPRLFAQAQLEQDYRPYVFSGSTPEVLKIDYEKEYQSYLKNNTGLCSPDAKVFYTNLILEKKNLVNSGNVYFGDPFTAYVNQVTDRLLKKNQELRAKIHVYVTRYASVNAFTFPDGSIYINMGLIMQLQNESQLAFIIAHEIAHYEKQHALMSYKQSRAVSAEQHNSYNPESSRFREMMYSREDEFEADARGAELIALSDYDINECPATLSILNDSLYSMGNIKLKTNAMINSEVFSIDSIYWTKPIAKTSAGKHFGNIFGNSTEDDLFSTHPNIEKRVLALQELIKLYNRSVLPKDSVAQRNYEALIETCRFETISNLYKNNYYYSCLYLSLYLIQKYPNNIFLKTHLMKSLYWWSFYREINNTSILDKRDRLFITKDALVLRTCFNSMEHNQLKKMLYGYAKKNYNEGSTSEEYLYYYALSTEMYIGKEAGRILYNTYLVKYPQGEFKTAITAKLNK